MNSCLITSNLSFFLYDMKDGKRSFIVKLFFYSDDIFTPIAKYLYRR